MYLDHTSGPQARDCWTVWRVPQPPAGCEHQAGVVDGDRSAEVGVEEFMQVLVSAETRVSLRVHGHGELGHPDICGDDFGAVTGVESQPTDRQRVAERETEMATSRAFTRSSRSAASTDHSPLARVTTSVRASVLRTRERNSQPTVARSSQLQSDTPSTVLAILTPPASSAIRHRSRLGTLTPLQTSSDTMMRRFRHRQHSDHRRRSRLLRAARWRRG